MRAKAMVEGLMGRFTRGRPRQLGMVIGVSLLVFGGAAPAGASSAGVSAISAGAYHTCAIRTDRSVWCWGAASKGQLGDGTTGDADHVRKRPVRVRRGSATFTRATSIAAGAASTCAARTDGTVWCWGDATQGQLGNGQSGQDVHRTRAVQVRRGSGFLTGVRQLATNGSHVCALRSNGSVLCWGNAASGQLGDGTTGDAVTHIRATAVRVRQGSGYLENVVAITAGYEHSCAVKADGSAWCWGNGFLGSLGDGQSGAGHHRTKAVRVRRGSGFLTGASGIAANGYHTCVRRTDATAWCWGYARNGQVGDGTSGDATTHLRTRAVQVLRGTGVLTRVASIGAGGDHTCARRTDGTAWCWGADAKGQLGDGTTGDGTTHVRLKPVRVRRSSSAFTDARRLVGGPEHTCALRADRSVWCWGGNSDGQLGRGSFDLGPHLYPRKVTFP
jgi:alpha-tubulin suppressor-like RCC1 family protein